MKSVGTTGSVGGIEITKDNTKEILESLDSAVERVLTMIGIKAEKYAKARCPVGTVESTGKKGYRGGTLRNSITFEVEQDEEGGTVGIGSNVEYAPYVELGTGGYFEQPPEWESFKSTKGSGLGGGYVHARPFLKPAIEDHISEYAKMIESELNS
jgi:HK97 gp10 family phage protein